MEILFNMQQRRLKGNLLNIQKRRINGNFLYPPGIHPKRTHESFVTAGKDILAGKNIDPIGTKPTSQGVFGPIKLKL